MTERPVYVIANFTIHDADTYRRYEKGFFPLLKRYGGEFITFDDASKTLEGSDAIDGRVVIFKFSNQKDAEAWYADQDYQNLSEHRRAGNAQRFLTMVHG